MSRIKRLFAIIVAALAFACGALFVSSCAEDDTEKTYDVAIRVSCTDGKTYEFPVGTNELSYEIPYTGKGRDFTVELVCNGEYFDFFHPFRRLGCRYLQFLDECEIEIAGLRETMYPVTEIPRRFADEQLQKIYDVGVRTLRLCMHEHYEDCPWREQALYAMDSRNQMLCGYYAEKYPETFDGNTPRELVYCGPHKMSDPLEGSALTVGQALLSPTRTYAPFVLRLLENLPRERVFGLIHCSGGALTKFDGVVTFCDALGLGIYAVFGTNKALVYGLSVPVALGIGFINAVGGGLLRDVIAREEPMVFKPGQFYGVVAFVGSGLYVFLHQLIPPTIAAILVALVTLVLRYAAIRLNLHSRPIADTQDWLRDVFRSREKPEPLPPEIFRGIDDVDNFEKLDDEQRKKNAEEKHGRRSRDGRGEN